MASGVRSGARIRCCTGHEGSSAKAVKMESCLAEADFVTQLIAKRDRANEDNLLAQDSDLED